MPTLSEANEFNRNYAYQDETNKLWAVFAGEAICGLRFKHIRPNDVYIDNTIQWSIHLLKWFHECLLPALDKDAEIHLLEENE